MKELNEIVKAYDKAILQNKQTALVTVVKVDGSSYRRPGARMLVTDDGKITGAISGGCLEGDALQKALFAMATGENKMISYDSTGEDDIQYGLHLGCNGVVHILFEPIKKDDPQNPVELLRLILHAGESIILVTLFSMKKIQPGTRLLYLKNTVHSSLPGHLQGLMNEAVQNAYAEKQSSFQDVVIEQTNCTAFIEYIEPPVSLVIAGAGNDIQPLVEMAVMLGWLVTVVDGRAQYALPERFPGASKVMYSKPADILSRIKTDCGTVFLLMSHNYNYDLGFLSQIAKKEFGYIGLLGPAQKRDRILSDLQDQGVRLSEEQLSKIYGPTGLDIGAENSTEIALSIIAEVKAFLSGRTGSSLKLKKESIHSRAINHLHHE
ncbi:MAG TPA: XdhC family protein [Puia sp.]|nr:XdhC family protein [Puia sp.]